MESLRTIINYSLDNLLGEKDILILTDTFLTALESLSGCYGIHPSPSQGNKGRSMGEISIMLPKISYRIHHINMHRRKRGDSENRTLDNHTNLSKTTDIHGIHPEDKLILERDLNC